MNTARTNTGSTIGSLTTKASGAAGKRIAWRNLAWSILAENLGFSVWLMWSVVATRLTLVGFKYTTDQLFQLVAICRAWSAR